MQPITTGTLAPLFQTQDIFGNSISLKKLRGKTILLSFFRNAACALCNLRIHDLIQQYPRYQKKGLVILAVFESPKENMLQYVAKQDVPFSLLADPQTLLYKLYQVENSENKIAHSMNLPETHKTVERAAQKGFALTPEEGSNFIRMPADFLIGPDGFLLKAHYSAHLTDHLPDHDIEKALKI